MEGTRIVLVRHGESMAQELGIVGGHEGCQGLSKRGRRQVESLRDRLAVSRELSEVHHLYSSVMPRAVETASILAPAFDLDEPVQECDLCEHHPGEGDGLSWDEFNERYPAPKPWSIHTRRDPGGETWAEMGERVARGLDTLVERHPGETIVVACHGGVVVWSMFRWLGLSAGDLQERAWISPENSSMTEWTFAPNPYARGGVPLQLVRYNDHAHLAGMG